MKLNHILGVQTTAFRVLRAKKSEIPKTQMRNQCLVAEPMNTHAFGSPNFGISLDAGALCRSIYEIIKRTS